MRTRQLRDNAGRLYAFAVENAYIQPSMIARLLRTLPETSSVQVRGLFKRPSDVHVRFVYKGKDWVVQEPYSDSSDYLIGPFPADADEHHICEVESVFRDYRVQWPRKVIGDFLSWRFFSIFRKY